MGEVIEIEGRHGIVFERIAGLSVLKAISQSPWLLLHYSKMLAKLHARLHDVIGPKELPSQREKLTGKIHLASKLIDETTIAKALDMHVRPSRTG